MVMLEASVSEVRQRAAFFVRAQYPQHAEKALQRDLDVSEATAERILSGDVSRPVLDRMLARWGWRFANFVLEPLCGNMNPAALDQRIARAEETARLALKEAEEIRREAAIGAGVADDRREAGRPWAAVHRPSGENARPAIGSDTVRFYSTAAKLEGEERRARRAGGRT